MESARIARIIEGSMVALFFLQAQRVVFAVLLTMLNTALAAQYVSPGLVYGHVLLLIAVLLIWFAPGARKLLPRTLAITALIVAAARIGLSFQSPSIRLYAGLVMMAASGIYFASILRASWRSFLTVLVAGLLLDQLFRAYDTFDLSLRVWHLVKVGELTYRVPWLAVQGVLSAGLIVLSRIARRAAAKEPYEPATTSLWGGITLGGYLALQVIILGMPNVIARWATVSYAGVVPWLLLATGLPLMPGARLAVGRLLALFDARFRGWVWLFVFVLLIVVGNRLGGLAGASALIMAQAVAGLLIWWVPQPPARDGADNVGPSLSLGYLVFTVLVYVYSLTFNYGGALTWLEGQAIIVVLLAAGLACLARLLPRGDDPWLAVPLVPRGLPGLLVFPLAVLGLVLSGYQADPIPASRDTLRVATYNINGGYDARGVYQLDLTTLSVEASLADVVLLQEVDTGRPVSLGVDQLQYLARHLNMYQMYQPGVERVQGAAILSRWPIQAGGGALLPAAAGETRAAVYARLQEVGGIREVTVVGAGLSPGTIDLRLRQFALLADLAGEDTPAVLGMDLAAGPDDVLYQQLVGSGFVDPDAVLGIERSFTAPAENPVVRHDFVLARGLNPLDSRQVDSRASDHRLVVVEFAWPE